MLLQTYNHVTDYNVVTNDYVVTNYNVVTKLYVKQRKSNFLDFYEYKRQSCLQDR